MPLKYLASTRSLQIGHSTKELESRYDGNGNTEPQRAQKFIWSDISKLAPIKHMCSHIHSTHTHTHINTTLMW